jgi:hypothetical protein
VVAFVVADQADYLVLGESFVGDLFCDDFPDDDSEAVNVGLLVDFILVSDDLRGHPLVGSHPFVPLLLFFLAGQPEVAELDDVPVLPDEDVGAFEVSVQYVFHVVEIDHSLYDFVAYFYFFHFVEFLVLFVELVEEAAIIEVLGHEDELVGSDADSHVKDDVGVLEVADDHQLLHEVLLVLVPLGLHVVLYRDQLPDVLPLVNLSIPSFPDHLQLLDVLFLYQELQRPVLLQKLVELSYLAGRVLVHPRIGGLLAGKLHHVAAGGRRGRL